MNQVVIHHPPPFLSLSLLFRAKHILCGVTREITKKFSLAMNPVDFVIAGIGNFSNRVVFAKVAEGTAKQKLEDIAGNYFLQI